MTPTRNPVPRESFWTYYATVYDLVWNSALTQLLARTATDALPADGLLVDIGCGTGLMSRSGRPNVVGIDTSAAMLRRARAKGRIPDAVLARAERLPLPNGCATAVIAANLLHLHADPAAIVNEALRVCSPDGRIFLCWPADNAEPGHVAAIERRLGRHLLSVLIADAFRRLIGRIATTAQFRRHSSDAIRAVVLDGADREVLTDRMIAGCQHVMILQPINLGPHFNVQSSPFESPQEISHEPNKPVNT